MNSTSVKYLRERVTNQYLQSWVNKVVKALQVSFFEKYQLKYVDGYSWMFEQELCVRLCARCWTCLRQENVLPSLPGGGGGGYWIWWRHYRTMNSSVLFVMNGKCCEDRAVGYRQTGKE